jgi:dephospho-CoA kinase
VLVIALTGGIGAGKSTAAQLFAHLGAVIVDADAIAHEEVEPGTPALARIVDRFGPGILDRDDRLDRPALAAIVFADAEARQDLEAITHPAIALEIKRRREAAPADAIVVCDVPLLTASIDRIRVDNDVVVVVEAPRAQRLERLETRGLSRADAEARIAAQPTDEQGRAIADHVLDNSGRFEDLEIQVETLWRELRSRA